MSVSSLPKAKHAATSSATTRRMLHQARELSAPPGWRLRWRVEVLESLTDPDEAVGWSDFDELEDAVANFRALRAPPRARARIVARLESPAAGREHA